MKILVNMELESFNYKNFEIENISIKKWIEKKYNVKVKVSADKVVDFLVTSNAQYVKGENYYYNDKIEYNLNGKKSRLMGYKIVKE